MTYRFCTHILLLALLAVAASGCVVTNQMAVRSGNRAYMQKDYSRAVEKYTEAAQAGDAEAQYHLGAMYAEGKGVPKNLTKAAEYLKKAAYQGQVDAQVMFGLMNVYGDGVEQNTKWGADLLSTAANNGSDVGMYYLANLYAAGLGVDKDLDKALYWMQEAKDAGFPVKDELLTTAGLEALYAN